MRKKKQERNKGIDQSGFPVKQRKNIFATLGSIYNQFLWPSCPKPPKIKVSFAATWQNTAKAAKHPLQPIPLELNEIINTPFTMFFFHFVRHGTNQKRTPKFSIHHFQLFALKIQQRFLMLFWDLTIWDQTDKRLTKTDSSQKIQPSCVSGEHHLHHNCLRYICWATRC